MLQIPIIGATAYDEDGEPIGVVKEVSVGASGVSVTIDTFERDPGGGEQVEVDRAAPPRPEPSVPFGGPVDVGRAA